MSAFGYGPFDNDDAIDMLFNLEDALFQLIKKFDTKAIYSKNEVRASAEIVIKFAKFYNFDKEKIIKPLIEELQKIQKDIDYVNKWSDPDLFLISVKRQIKMLSDIILKKDI